eukprot:2599504-Prymnesium_polylepis.1
MHGTWAWTWAWDMEHGASGITWSIGDHARLNARNVDMAPGTRHGTRSTDVEQRTSRMMDTGNARARVACEQEHAARAARARARVA